MQKRITLKLIVIFLLGLLLLIPLMMIQGKINERERYLENVKHSISSSWTGSQQLSTPVLVIPYDVLVARELNTGTREAVRSELVTEKRYSLVPFDDAKIKASVQAHKRFKGIYSVPVYSSDIVITANLKSAVVRSAFKEIAATPGYSQTYNAYIGNYINDMRGIAGAPLLSINGESKKIISGSGIPGLASGLKVALQVGAVNEESADIQINLSYKLNGMENIEVLPTARNLVLSIESNWPHPEFIGSFLPNVREINVDGFSATWQLNEFSTNISEIMQRCGLSDCYALNDKKMGVKLFESIDVYQQTERAIKYALLFIVVSFVAFFVFEALREISIHPIQYILVGFSLAIFYLLLIALSEHIPFSVAYGAAALACTALITMYLRYVVGNWRESGYFGGSLGGLYLMLFVILQQEDFALLSGSLLTFLLLATLMMSTRNIDWYAIAKTPAEKTGRSVDSD